MNDQKKKELESLQKLLKLIDFEVNEKIIPEESPDFLINFDEKILGIEIVEIFQPQTDDAVRIQHQESIKKNIVDNTESELVGNGLPPMKVFISFNDYFHLNFDTSQFILEGNDQYDFPLILAEIISNNIPEIGEKIEIYGVDCERIPIKINSLKIYHEDCFEEICVNTSTGGILPPLDKATLEKKINAKNEKIELYKQKCDECWLLISSNDYQFEKAFDLKNSKEALTDCFEYNFERVFFLEEDFEELFEIEMCT